MPMDLSALIARVKDMPAGATVTVLIPRGNPVTIGGCVYQEHDTYAVPAALFAPASATPQPDPDRPRTLIAGESLNVRAEPEASSARLGSVQAGTSVQAFDHTSNGYRQISLTGWVLEQHLGQP